jgi:glycosyltransferase involved in cell wall biosynthesis
MSEKLRIAAFGGFRTIPPKPGGAGSDKFAFELYPRIVAHGHELIAYTRIYPGDEIEEQPADYRGIRLKAFKTVQKAGFDSLVHSFKATLDVIFHNTADVVHLHSGANSIWAFFLRLAGKRVIVTQFAMDWKRDKWPWYGKLFYIFSNYLTAFIPNVVVFDNIFTKEYFEKKYRKKFQFIAYGCEVPHPSDNEEILRKLGLERQEYFLFVGRFIPDKGIHLLVKAFEQLKTDKKLILIGGSPNPDKYESEIRDTKDSRIIFPGYIYGEETNILIKNAYAYVQPSLIEGLSPVILTVMGLGTPLICSDIKENLFITRENASVFESGNADSLKIVMENSMKEHENIIKMSENGKKDVISRFNWDQIAVDYIETFRKIKK